MKKVALIGFVLFCLVSLCIAETVTIWVCPKCGSEDIDISIEKPPIEYQRKSIDEWANQPWVSIEPAVLKLYKWIAVCRKCGYAVEAMRP